MRTAAKIQPDSGSVPAEITYTLHTGEKPVNETFEAGQIIRRRTGATEQRITQIRDARPLQGELSLDVHGFVLAQHATQVANFFDPAPDDLIPAERRYPDRVGETYQLSYNAAHRWFYFPRMRREEALVFKVYDSQTDGRARFTPHTSFEDPGSPADAPPRQSIEVRTFAFFG